MSNNEKETAKQKNNTKPSTANRNRDRDKSDNPVQKKGSISTKNIGQFILGEKLGEGTFGTVRLGTHILTGEKVININKKLTRSQ